MHKGLAAAFDPERSGEATALSDVAHVRALLIAAARAGRAVGYAELLAAMGFRFTRPRMRALCRTLDAVDALSRAAGEPDLAIVSPDVV